MRLGQPLPDLDAELAPYGKDGRALAAPGAAAWLAVHEIEPAHAEALRRAFKL
ncbi:MAG: hypothetical protein H6740_25245 [Alphaproteobacteria bacterium]|nr:hypothetical protein [Alphaproteobacteria bacterium]